MRAKDIQVFFRELNRRIPVPVQVTLTGGAAAILQGVRRATHDIDFELTIQTPGHFDHAAWEDVQKAMDETRRATGITPQYAEDIEKWSSISLPTKLSHLYFKLEKVEVRILDPGPWAIGKLARFLASDVEDLRTVLKHAKTNASTLARLWGKALGISPTSNTLGSFHRQVESFFDNYAQEIWGPKAVPGKLKKIFNNSAQENRRARLR